MNISNKDATALKDVGTVFIKLVSDKSKNNGKTAIKVENLNFSIKKRLLLNNVSFEVKAGEMHGFIGPNGAGKTTTIKNIIDAYTTRTPESKITIMGHPVGSVKAKKCVAYIPEYAAFPDHLTLQEYLQTMAKFSNFNSIDSKKKSIELMEILGLSKHSHVNPNDFSSGMKKKVLLAQALMTDPEILILDEPAANLDPSARNLLFSSLKELTKKGLSILISSHILAELEGLVNSVTMINNGNISYSGSVEKISNKIKSNMESQIRVVCDIKIQKIVTEIANKLKLNVINDIRSVLINAKNEKQIFKVVEEIAKAQLQVNAIEFNKITLQDIYDKEFL